MDISIRIKELRLKNNFTVDEISTKLAMSRQQIYNWETGKSNPSANILDKLAQLYNVDVKYFFTESNNIGQNLNPDLIFVLKEQIEDLKKDKERLIKEIEKLGIDKDYFQSQNKMLLVK